MADCDQPRQFRCLNKRNDDDDVDDDNETMGYMLLYATSMAFAVKLTEHHFRRYIHTWGLYTSICGARRVPVHFDRTSREGREKISPPAVCVCLYYLCMHIDARPTPSPHTHSFAVIVCSSCAPHIFIHDVDFHLVRGASLALGGA